MSSSRLHLVVRLGIELVEPEEPIDLGVVGEVQPVPVDDRLAAEQQPDGLDVGERELVSAGRPRDPRQDGADHASSLRATWRALSGATSP